MTRVTAQDVARRAGVSRATVSYVLNDHPTQTIPVVTRDKVLRAAAELEYTPLASARNLRRGRSDVVVMLIPDWPLGPVIPAMMESIAQGLAPHGLELFLHRCLKDRPVKKLWRAITPAAVIRTGSLGPEEDEGLRRSQLGFLLELGMAENEDGLVLFPGTAAGRLQAEHLVVRGHERLGFAWPDDPRLEGFAKSRLKGVQLTCRRHGLQPPVVERLSLRRPPGEAGIAGAARVSPASARSTTISRSRWLARPGSRGSACRRRWRWSAWTTPSGGCSPIPRSPRSHRTQTRSVLPSASVSCTAWASARQRRPHGRRASLI